MLGTGHDELMASQRGKRRKPLAYIKNFAAAVRPHVWQRSYSRSIEIRLKAVS